MKKSTVIFGLLLLILGQYVSAQPEKRIDHKNFEVEVKEFTKSKSSYGLGTSQWGGFKQIDVPDSFREIKDRELFDVTFNVDMSFAEDFDPDNDVVYITGSMLGWASPGDQPNNQTMTRVDDSMIWSKTLALGADTYQYKYFLNYGWDWGEWDGDPNRMITVAGDMEVNDVWGTYIEPANYINLIRGGPAGTNPLAIPVQITGVNAAPWSTNLNQWTGSWQAPQAIYDQGEHINNPGYWSNIENNPNAGTTWNNPQPGTGYGILVVDLQQERQLYALSVFQMFSDGKTTHIALASHPTTGNTAPNAFDEEWVEFLPVSPVGPGENFGTFVGNPTTFPVDQATRYVKIMAYNDGNLGNPWYIELKGIKAYGAGDLPLVITLTVDDITQDSAVASGEVVHQGSSLVTARGMVWGAMPDPDLDNNLGFSQEGEGMGHFSSILSGLEPNTKYYVRSYATNNHGTNYSATLSFTTLFDMSDIFAGGSGTEEDPWLIETAEHLNNIRLFLGPENTDKYFMQIADIDLGVAPWNEGQGWVPIGVSNYEFRGHYNGGDYVISGLFINRLSAYQGLFGIVRDATIKNLQIDNSQISLGNYSGIMAGAIIGNTYAGNITIVSSSITSSEIIGGMVGLSSGNNFLENIYCDVSINITGNFAGGIAAVIQGGGTLSNSISSGNIIAGARAGGLVGSLSASQITNAYAIGNVNAGDYAGGLIGQLLPNSTVSNCYSNGFVSGSQFTGGLIGYNRQSNIFGSFWDTETSGQSESDGGTGLPTEQMKDYETYILAGWDFKGMGQFGIWNIGNERNDGYPYLDWQFPDDPPLDLDIWPPVVITYYVYDITHNSAYVTAAVVQMGNPVAHQHGICWNTSGSPTIEDDNTQEGPVTDFGEYISFMDNLQPNTTYYVRAYIVNDDAIQYGNELSVSTLPMEALAPEGSGTENEPYLIGSLSDLYWVAQNADSHDKYFLQTDDIDAGETDDWHGGEGWIPIAQYWSLPFTGNYNGDGHTISGLTINRPYENYQSLFGFITDGTITNLNIQNSHIVANQRAAVLAGWVDNTHISNINIANSSVTASHFAGGLVSVASSGSMLENIHTHAEVSSMGGYAGGIAGTIQSESTLANSSSSGYVYASSVAGGIAGWLTGGVISQSYSTSNVFVETQYAGGLVGIFANSHLNNSYATGYVNGNNAGGLIGTIFLNDYATTPLIINNYSVAPVQGEINTGGLVGNISEEASDPLFDFQNNYWNSETSGQESSAVGEGLSTPEMLIQTNFSNWDFAETWSNIENIT
ncbi:MAG: hypothetical protein EA361_15245, partial [Bacteroidetes bacterium]